MAESLAFLNNATLGTYMGPLVRGMTWNLHQGEAWLVTGPAASGKSTLAGFLAGTVSILEGTGRAPADAVLVDSTRQQTALALEWRHDLGDFTEGGDPGTTLEEWYRSQGGLEHWRKAFALEPRLSTGIKFLSSGELRRAFLAAAFSRAQSLLVLDSPTDGLDKEGQSLLLDALRRWKTPERTLVTFVSEGSRIEFPWTAVWSLPSIRRTTLSELSKISIKPLPKNTPVIELDRGRLAYGTHVLAENLSWQVYPGEAWRLAGPNGCGKSTLLSLISGESPMAFTNNLRLFGKHRGPDLTLDEVRAQVRWVSPRLLEDFGARFAGTVGEVILSGWDNTQGLRGLEPRHLARARELAETFGVAGDWARAFGALSRGRQTAVLSARAGMRLPGILILDEPGQALDRPTLDILHGMAYSFLRNGAAVLLVAHNESQVPDWISHVLEWTQENSIVTRRL